jgi:hypothetical protein
MELQLPPRRDCARINGWDPDEYPDRKCPLCATLTSNDFTSQGVEIPNTSGCCVPVSRNCKDDINTNQPLRPLYTIKILASHTSSKGTPSYHAFDIHSLYQWVIHYDNKTQPKTRRPLTEEEVKQIYDMYWMPRQHGYLSLLLHYPDQFSPQEEQTIWKYVNAKEIALLLRDHNRRSALIPMATQHETHYRTLVPALLWQLIHEQRVDDVQWLYAQLPFTKQDTVPMGLTEILSLPTNSALDLIRVLGDTFTYDEQDMYSIPIWIWQGIMERQAFDIVYAVHTHWYSFLSIYRHYPTLMDTMIEYGTVELMRWLRTELHAFHDPWYVNGLREQAEAVGRQDLLMELEMEQDMREDLFDDEVDIMQQPIEEFDGDDAYGLRDELMQTRDEFNFIN